MDQNSDHGRAANRKLYVSNLPRASQDSLKSLCSTYGEVREVQFKSRNNSFFYAFVEFASHDDALKAMNKLHNSDFHGNRLKAEWSGKKPQQIDPSRFQRFQRSRSRNRYLPRRSSSYSRHSHDRYDYAYDNYAYGRRIDDPYREREYRNYREYYRKDDYRPQQREYRQRYDYKDEGGYHHDPYHGYERRMPEYHYREEVERRPPREREHREPRDREFRDHPRRDMRQEYRDFRCERGEREYRERDYRQKERDYRKEEPYRENIKDKELQNFRPRKDFRYKEDLMKSVEEKSEKIDQY